MAQTSMHSGEHQKIVRISSRRRDVGQLPPSDTRRWVGRRKAQVVAAVRDGTLSLEDACARYSLSSEEFEAWQALVDDHGIRGLRATRMQEYRPADGRPHQAAAE